MKNKKPWYEKISIWVTIIAGIIAIVTGMLSILGINIFRNKTLIDDDFINTINNDSEENIDNNILEESSNNEERLAKEYHKGNVTKYGWKSEYFDICFIAPEGMNMYTEDELNDKMGIGQEILFYNFDELQSIYAELSLVYEMISNDLENNSSVMVLVNKLENNTDAYQFIESYNQQSSQDANYNYTLINNVETIKIANSDFLKAVYEVYINDICLFQDYYVNIIEDRAITIIVTYFDESVRDDIISAFKTYKN